MKPTNSFGVCSWITRCLAQLALCGMLCAAEPDAAEFNKAAFDGNWERMKELLAKDPALLNGTGESGTASGAAVLPARKDLVELLLLSKGAAVELPALQCDVPKGSDGPMPKRRRVPMQARYRWSLIPVWSSSPALRDSLSGATHSRRGLDILVMMKRRIDAPVLADFPVINPTLCQLPALSA